MGEAMDLQECRQQIDRIDREIGRLLGERMDVSRAVAEYKIEHGKTVYDPAREEQKLKQIREEAPAAFCAAAFTTLTWRGSFPRSSARRT